MSKIFEYCILDNFTGIETSERQFGFKPKVGCNNSLYNVRKVINFFNKRQSTVNIGVIDLRKAFDKVNNYGILCMLQENYVSSNVINVIENWFSKNCITVKWNGTTSDQVKLQSGVKQGGVLSPFLFSLFVDCVLKKLEKSKLGCFIGLQCLNSFMYADDIILLSISVTDLQLMFDICSNVFKQLDLPINISKCHCMRVGPRANISCAKLNVETVNIDWVESTKYLGINICQSKTFKCSWDDVKGKFYSSVNTILGRLGTMAPINVLMKLISSQAVPILMYGLAAVTLSSADMKSLTHTYNSVFAKIFKSFDVNVIACCQFYSGYLTFEMLYEFNRYNFLHKMITAACFDNRLSVDKTDYQEYTSLQNKYNFKSNDSHRRLKSKLWNLFSDQVNLICFW